MVDLHPNILKFLNKNKELIQEEKFEELYEDLYNYRNDFSYSPFQAYDIGKLTKVFYDLDELDNILRLMNGIPPLMFYGISGIDTLTIPGNISFTGLESFEKSEFKKVIIEPGCQMIGRQSFYGCKAEKIELPDTVTNFNDHCFYLCSNLTSFKIPRGLQHIGHNAFGRCDNLTEIWVPKSLKSWFLEQLEYSGPDFPSDRGCEIKTY